MNRREKRRFRPLLCGILLVTATSLLGMFSGTSVSASQKPITITLTTWTATQPGMTVWWPDITKAFEKANPGVTLKVEEVAYADYIQGLTTDFVANHPPDIVHIPLPETTLPAWAEAGFLLPLTSQLRTTGISKLWPSAQESMAWNGTTYGVLLQNYGYLLFYNSALLKQAGQSVPKTPQQLLAAAKATTKNGNYGFAVDQDNTVNVATDAQVFITGMDGSLAKNGKWNLTGKSVLDALNLWRTLGTQYSPKGTDINAKRQAFLDGNVAMIIDNPTVWPSVATLSPASVRPNLHLAQVPFPTTPGNVSNGLAIPQGISGRARTLAWDFIKLASSPKWMRALAQDSGATVSRPGESSVLASNPDTAQIPIAEEHSSLIIPAGDTGIRKGSADFYTDFEAALQTLLTTNAPIRQVMTSLQSQLVSAGIEPVAQGG